MTDAGQRRFRLQIGPYWILLPRSAEVVAEVGKPPLRAYQDAFTHWRITLERFRLYIHLGPLNDLAYLKPFIDQETKSDVLTPPMRVNGIDGVTHGGYGPPRTWIDWWFKKGDTMICMCLQSKSFPMTEPTEEEVAEHNSIVQSIKYCRDFSEECPPLL